ncbi:MAG: hypothetical protein MJE66_12900 [Proteobacteria bacterium]|nr:hypothetical protein [Pseudomonadota bacterium]
MEPQHRYQGSWPEWIAWTGAAMGAVCLLLLSLLLWVQALEPVPAARLQVEVSSVPLEVRGELVPSTDGGPTRVRAVLPDEFVAGLPPQTPVVVQVQVQIENP